MNDVLATLSDRTIVETMILSSATPVSQDDIAERIGYPVDIRRIVDDLNGDYETRSLSIVEVAPGRWAARTKPEFSDLCRQFLPKPLRRSRAGDETLAIIAYFQPVTRGEIERVRGVSLSAGTLEILIYAGLVRLGPRRASPGNPMTFMTTDLFLLTFNLRSLEDLPSYSEMKEQGLLNAAKGLTGAPAGLRKEDADASD